jgi:hypothetical protein
MIYLKGLFKFKYNLNQTFVLWKIEHDSEYLEEH